MERLVNKVAIVTGGGSGLGSAIVRRLYEEGVKVVIADLNYEVASNLAKSLGDRAYAVKCDVSLKESVDKMVEEVIQKFDTVDILVNNAGITMDASLKNMDENAWDKVINVNLKSVYLCTKVVAPYMAEKQWGRVINMSSLAGVAGNFGQTNYAASKAGIIGITKTLSKELGRKNITVNAIAPGFMDTEMTRVIPEDIQQKLLAQIPLGRKGKPEEIGAAVTYLASEEAGFINGETLNINGGFYS